MPSTQMATFGTRLFTAFRGGVWIKPNKHKTETGAPGANNNQGARDLIRLQVERSPNQTSDMVDVLDENLNILWSIDSAGNVIQSGVTAVKKYIAQITLTAAQITTLHSVPVSLIAAPGAGKAILLEKLSFQFKFGTTPFTGGGAVSPVYHGATTDLLSGSVAQATVQGSANALISAGAPAAALALTPNTGVDFLAASADFAAGDSTAIVTVWYDIITEG